MSKIKYKQISKGFKRFFWGQNTAVIAAIISIVLVPVIFIFGNRCGTLDMPGAFNFLIRLILIATLFYAFTSHKLFLLQATTVGLLFCMLCAQSQYALGALATTDSEVYITMGLQGFIFLAGERMLLFIQCFICVGHFVIHSAKRQVAIRVSLNQIALLFLLGLSFVQLVISPFLTFAPTYVFYIWTSHLEEFFIFLLIACAELVLVVDGKELGGGMSNVSK